MDRGKFAEPLKLRGVEMSNRLWMSPMCQYSAGTDGLPNNWHLVHYGARAMGGAGMIMVESTAIGPRHRTTDSDLGIWNAAQIDAHRILTALIRELGSIPAVQLQCAGRKSSHMVPWVQSGQNSAVAVADGGWIPLAPSSNPFGKLTVPAEMSHDDIDEVVSSFAAAAINSHEAGYDVVEVHAAHGYLLHQFLSPLVNQRTDEYGGSLENRMRLPLRVAEAVRGAFPQEKAVSVRVTSTDWIDGGITFDEALAFSNKLAGLGIDLLDVTSGALTVDTPPPNEDGLNLKFAEMLGSETGLAVAPVGRLSDPKLLKDVFDTSPVDAVFLGRSLLTDPYYPLRLVQGAPKDFWPKQYHRGL